MNTNMTFFATKGEFSQLYQNLSSKTGLMTTLTQMQKTHNITERKAYENADTIVRMVAAHQNVCNMLSEDSMAVLDDFLADSVKLSDYDRKIQLHKMYFGLKMYQDEALVDLMKNGATEDQLFRDYFTAYGEDPSITESMLEDNIRKLLGSYHLTPAAMRAVTSQLNKKKDLLASSATLGEKGQHFKCIVAMDLYLRHKDTMSMDEAVRIACTHTEMEAVADAVSRGQVTEKIARKTVTILAIACIILAACAGLYALALNGSTVSAAFHVTTQTVSQATQVGFAGNVTSILETVARKGAIAGMNHTSVAASSFGKGMLFSGAGLTLISDKVAHWFGSVAAKHTFIRHANEAKAIDLACTSPANDQLTVPTKPSAVTVAAKKVASVFC